jgi:hypothetical protein
MKRFAKVMACLAPVLAALFARRAAALHPEWTERYFSRGVYPALAQFFSFATGLVPFALIGKL